MPLPKTIKREFEVAFSKKSQPVWFRIVKYIVFALILYFFWGKNLLWIILGVLVIGSIALHFWYRHKTQGWTRSYGLWKYDKEDKDI